MLENRCLFTNVRGHTPKNHPLAVLIENAWCAMLVWIHRQHVQFNQSYAWNIIKLHTHTRAHTHWNSSYRARMSRSWSSWSLRASEWGRERYRFRYDRIQTANMYLIRAIWIGNCHSGRSLPMRTVEWRLNGIEVIESYSLIGNNHMLIHQPANVGYRVYILCILHMENIVCMCACNAYQLGNGQRASDVGWKQCASGSHCDNLCSTVVWSERGVRLHHSKCK